MLELGHADTIELKGKTNVISCILRFLNWGRRCETDFQSWS